MNNNEPILGELKEEDFQYTEWKGQKRFLCPLYWESGAKCEYDTHDLEMMRDHINTPHVRDPKAALAKQSNQKGTRKIVSSLVDEHGRSIIRDIPDECKRAGFKDDVKR